MRVLASSTTFPPHVTAALARVPEEYDNHAAFKWIGLPEWLAVLEDSLFERLWRVDEDAARSWPERLLQAVPVGLDLDRVRHRFLLAVLTDEQYGARRYADVSDQAAIDRGIALLRRASNGEQVPEEEWEHAAAAYAARAAAAAYAADAAAYAAYAAAYAVDAVSYDTAAADAARAAVIRWQADTLLRLLQEA